MNLEIRSEISSWKLREPFSISRGSKTQADVLDVFLLEDGVVAGKGEGTPYPRYGETPETSRQEIFSVRDQISQAGLSRDALLSLMKSGAARNALDAAIWDYEARKHATPVWALAGIRSVAPVETACTISVDHPDRMYQAALKQNSRPLLKIKLNGKNDLQRVRACRSAAPESRLIVDANESWTPESLTKLSPAMRELGVELIEQPLPAGDDEFLGNFTPQVPLCADESFKTADQLPGITNKYQCVNIKLDKTGGLTAALPLAYEARSMGLKIMVGCMVCTSLGTAPALILAQSADWADLDGPLLLSTDRPQPLKIEGSSLCFPEKNLLWGGG